MGNKKHKIKIEIPKGYEVDFETESTEVISYDSDFTKIKYQANLKPIKKPLPKTWEEYFSESGDKIFGTHINVFVPMKYQVSYNALRKLLQLRDHYNDGWEPDWTNDYSKFVIWIDRNSLAKACITNGSHILTFKMPELRDEFLNNFEQLIIEAKPLL